MAELSGKVYEKVKTTGFVIRLSQNLPYTGNVPVSAEAVPPVFGQPSEVMPHREVKAWFTTAEMRETMPKTEERLLDAIKSATGFHGQVYPMRLADRQMARKLVSDGRIVEAAGSWGTTMCIGYRINK
ncbi:hypothetical protein [Rhizobium tumorigenes]|uniref:hypothetical protein n=1 Tax=Rhizobium tumorigenes TaxID=2041385 RepID=UPI0024200635|nr:hypothetical protein [Rhizobium tumorigenes]WFS01196.1 hypothetical protein PR016_00715 [Rhizobium tumorigenes]